MSLYQTAAQPAMDRTRSDFAATFDLQLELWQEVDGSVPDSSGSNSGQEQSFAPLLPWSPLMTVPRALVSVYSGLFYTVAQQNVHSGTEQHY